MHVEPLTFFFAHFADGKEQRFAHLKLVVGFRLSLHVCIYRYRYCRYWCEIPVVHLSLS